MKRQLITFIKNLINKKTMRNIVWLYIFSILISTLFYTHINDFVTKLVPVSNMVVTVTEASTSGARTEIWMSLLNGKEITKEQFDSMPKTGVWEYRSIEEWGYGNDTILSYGDNVGSTIVLPIKKAPYGGITIWCQAYSRAIDVEANSVIEHYELYSEEGSLLQITPYEDVMTTTFLTVIVYLVFSLIIMLLLLLLIYLFNRLANNDRESRYSYKLATLAIFAITYIHNVIWYKIGIVNFNAFGDQNYYWNNGGVFATPGITIGEMVAHLKSLSPLRGYGNYVQSFIAQFIGNRIGINSYLIYFLLLAMTFAILFGYVLPKMYELFHGKKVFAWQVVMSLAGFAYLYRGMLVAIGGDLFGLTLYLLAALLLALYNKEVKIKYAVGAGAVLSYCLAIRTSYLIGSYIIILCFLYISGHKVYIYIKKEHSHIKHRGKVKRVGLSIAAFFLAFFIVCIPQIYKNHLRGHKGLFAYDMDGTYGTKTTTLLEANADWAVSGVLTGYPYVLYDNQIKSIRIDAKYVEDKELTMSQSFDAYARKPLDTFVSILKRAFLLIDMKTNVTLPDEPWYASTKNYVYSTVNYVLAAIALFVIINKKTREKMLKKQELFFWAIVALPPVLPLLASRIEWRGAMVLQIFYISYSVLVFTNHMRTSEGKNDIINSNILPFVFFWVLVFHSITLSMFH